MLEDEINMYPPEESDCIEDSDEYELIIDDKTVSKNKL